jgi:uncharacterized protein (TIGR00725 family)
MKEILPKLKIVISGAAVTEPCSENIHELAYNVGKRIAELGLITVTGATTGVPLWAAKGAFENGGFVLGLSPARSLKEHINVYRLPIDYHHLIIYTGEGYSGRNLLLTRTGDGIIFICGRMGTLNEFTNAFEEEKIMGVLVGSGGTEKLFDEIIEEAKRGRGKIIWEKDPINLVDKLVEYIKKELEDVSII